MSSYLTIYLQPKQEGAEPVKEPMPLLAYSRSNDVYQIMRDELSIAYVDDKRPYSNISCADIHGVVKTQRDEIKRVKQHITSMRKTLKEINNAVVINEKIEMIESQESYVKEMQATLLELLHIESLVESVESNKCWAAFSKVVANVD